MKKNAKKTRIRKAKNSPAPPGPLAPVIRRRLFEFIVIEGLKVLNVVLEEDRTQVCRPRYSRHGDTSHPVRWGATTGELVMGGRRVVVSKPRVRQDGREVELPTWAQFADEDPLNVRALEQMLVGNVNAGLRSFSRTGSQ